MMKKLMSLLLAGVSENIAGDDEMVIWRYQ
jgi:hypothetical protein